MGLVRFLKKLLGARPAPVLQGDLGLADDAGLDLEELSRRLDLPAATVKGTAVCYSAFDVPKRSGGRRRIQAPSPELKQLQRRLLRRVLGRLPTHPAAVGFEAGHSIATHASAHVGQAVVVRMDVKDFFPSTRSERIYRFFRLAGWNGDAADRLVNLCTYKGGLPQGAPTSPRLSNLVNYLLDARLSGLGVTAGALYTRWADDLTFSLGRDDPHAIHGLIGSTKAILADFGYRLHTRRKLHIRRRHQRQVVTGLVVNEQVNLPRATRRWLRAVEHRLDRGLPASLDADQLAGWRALEQMVLAQTDRRA
ncbi:MAG: reverse transcriptase family protein [Phycisphaerae bacterium]|nr:reverse transcriptase family protein [Phycisphaerae bacterium]